MSQSRRVLRSAGRAGLIATLTATHEFGEVPPSPHIPKLVTFTDVGPANSSQDVSVVSVGSKLAGLNNSELNLLRRKQQQLIANTTSTVTSLPEAPKYLNALSATLIFSDYEAGTAVCIDSAGWILTCSHCFGESEEE